MSNYVYDNTSLPSGKVDAPGKNLGVPANQKLTAAEYAVLTQAIEDLRAALLAGQYHGFALDTVAAISTSGNAKLRATTRGQLQVSENGQSWERFRGVDYIHVDDYGAVGDGVTDDAAAINAAITAAANAGKGIDFGPKTYLVNSALSFVNTKKIFARGRASGSTPTTIKAGASMAALATVTGTHYFSDLVFDANRYATDSLLCDNGSAGTVFERVTANGAKRYGFHIGPNGVNDTLVFRDCSGTSNGRYWLTSGMPTTDTATAARVTVTGTVATTSGSAVLTGTGTTFTAIGLAAEDTILVGASGTEVRQVVSVDSDTQITVALPFSTTRSGQGYGALQGAGYREARHNDCNINKVHGGLWRANAQAGLIVQGLYSSYLENLQTDFNYGYGVIYGATEGPSYGGVVKGCYFEANGSITGGSTGFLIGAAEGATFSGNMLYGVATEYSLSVPSYSVSGVWIGQSEIKPIGLITGTGGDPTICRIPVSKAHAQGFKMEGAQFEVAQLCGLSGGTTGSFGLDKTSSLLVVYGSGDITATATPSWTGTVNEGQIVRLYNANAGVALTLQDESILPGSKLNLSRSKITLLANECITFLVVGAYLQQIGLVENFRATDSTASPGAATQDVRRGRVAIAAGAASVVVTNKLVTATSIIHATLQSNDTTLTRIKNIIPTAGSFTITGDANATATTKICWSLES